MKSILLTLFSIPFIFNAQITIGKSNFPNSGDNYIYSLATTVGIDVSTTGANQTWDYSNIAHTSFDTIIYVSVGSTSIAYQLYFNNPFTPNYKANYAIKGKEINAFNVVTISEVFNYHKKNNSSLEMVGFGANINGIPASIKYNTIDQLYPLPMTFGTTDSTSADYLLDVPNMGTYGQWIERKVEVDGWGEVTTPNQTYAQSIRVKTTLYQRDTLKTEQPIPLPGVAFDRPVQHIYEWFVAGVGAPILSITEQGGQISNAKYFEVNATTIAENNDFEFSIFPNPAKNLINITTPFNNGLMQIMDLSGRLIFDGQLKTTFDVSNLETGSYLLIVINDNKKSYQVFQKN